MITLFEYDQNKLDTLQTKIHTQFNKNVKDITRLANKLDNAQDSLLNGGPGKRKKEAYHKWRQTKAGKSAKAKYDRAKKEYYAAKKIFEAKQKKLIKKLKAIERIKDMGFSKKIDPYSKIPLKSQNRKSKRLAKVAGGSTKSQRTAVYKGTIKKAKAARIRKIRDLQKTLSRQQREFEAHKNLVDELERQLKFKKERLNKVANQADQYKLNMYKKELHGKKIQRDLEAISKKYGRIKTAGKIGAGILTVAGVTAAAYALYKRNKKKKNEKLAAKDAAAASLKLARLAKKVGRTKAAVQASKNAKRYIKKAR